MNPQLFGPHAAPYHPNPGTLAKTDLAIWAALMGTDMVGLSAAFCGHWEPLITDTNGRIPADSWAGALRAQVIPAYYRLLVVHGFEQSFIGVQPNGFTLGEMLQEFSAIRYGGEPWSHAMNGVTCTTLDRGSLRRWFTGENIPQKPNAYRLHEMCLTRGYTPPTLEEFMAMLPGSSATDLSEAFLAQLRALVRDEYQRLAQETHAALTERLDTHAQRLRGHEQRLGGLESLPATVGTPPNIDDLARAVAEKLLPKAPPPIPTPPPRTPPPTPVTPQVNRRDVIAKKITP